MIIPILVLKNQQCDWENDQYYEDYEETEVDVPLMEICEILGKQFGISAETMFNIIDYFEIDLDYEVENNAEIQRLAETKYAKESD